MLDINKHCYYDVKQKLNLKWTFLWTLILKYILYWSNKFEEKYHTAIKNYRSIKLRRNVGNYNSSSTVDV